jgi:hypothetical protein
VCGTRHKKRGKVRGKSRGKPACEFDSHFWRTKHGA